jgi:hypothetical protein
MKFTQELLRYLLLGGLSGLMLTLVAVDTQGQTTPQSELRVVNHLQRFHNRKNIGFAAYINEPDTIRGGARVFGVAGVTFRDKSKTRWLEIMGGGLVNHKGFNPALDVRGQTKLNTLHGLTLWGQYLHLFKSDQTILSVSVTKVVRKRIKLGVESDTLRQNSKNYCGVGPGVGVLLNEHLQIWSAYQVGIGEQRSIWRTYFVLNW